METVACLQGKMAITYADINSCVTRRLDIVNTIAWLNLDTFTRFCLQNLGI